MWNVTAAPTEAYRQASEQHVSLRAALGTIAVLSFLGNGLLVLVFIRNQCLLKTPYNALILSLALTDMTTGECFALMAFIMLHFASVSKRVLLQSLSYGN